MTIIKNKVYIIYVATSYIWERVMKIGVDTTNLQGNNIC